MWRFCREIQRLRCIGIFRAVGDLAARGAFPAVPGDATRWSVELAQEAAKIALSVVLVPGIT
jgi:hypothetical protein